MAFDLHQAMKNILEQRTGSDHRFRWVARNLPWSLQDKVNCSTFCRIEHKLTDDVTNGKQTSVVIESVHRNGTDQPIFSLVRTIQATVGGNQKVWWAEVSILYTTSHRELASPADEKKIQGLRKVNEHMSHLQKTMPHLPMLQLNNWFELLKSQRYRKAIQPVSSQMKEIKSWWQLMKAIYKQRKLTIQQQYNGSWPR